MGRGAPPAASLDCMDEVWLRANPGSCSCIQQAWALRAPARVKPSPGRSLENLTWVLFMPACRPRMSDSAGAGLTQRPGLAWPGLSTPLAPAVPSTRGPNTRAPQRLHLGPGPWSLSSRSLDRRPSQREAHLG